MIYVNSPNNKNNNNRKEEESRILSRLKRLRRLKNKRKNKYILSSFISIFSMSASVSSHLTCCLMKRHLDSLKSIILSIYWICRQNLQSIVGNLKLILSLYTSFVLERVAYFRCLQQRLHVTYMLCDGILYYKV